MPPIRATIVSFFAVSLMLAGQLSAASVDAGVVSGVASRNDETRAHIRHVFFVFKADSINRVEVSSRLGHIELTPHAEKKLPGWVRKPDRGLPEYNPMTDVLVVAQVHALRPELLDEVVLEPAIDNGVLSIKAVWPDSKTQKSQSGVDYVLRMPVVVAYDLKTGLGDIRISDAHGAGTAKSGLGDVEIRDQRGAVTASSGLGDVDVAFLPDHAGRSDLTSGLGDISVEGLTEGEVVTGQGDISAEISSTPTGEIKIASGMGEVRVDLPEHIDAMLEASTAMGSLRIGRQFSTFERRQTAGLKSVKAELGEGGYRIVCTTTMGSVVVD